MADDRVSLREFSVMGEDRVGLREFYKAITNPGCEANSAEIINRIVDAASGVRRNSAACDICGPPTSSDGLRLCPACAAVEKAVGGDVAVVARLVRPYL